MKIEVELDDALVACLQELANVHMHGSLPLMIVDVVEKEVTPEKWQAKHMPAMCGAE